MKKKKFILLGIAIVIVIISFLIMNPPSQWSQKTFDAVVEEIVEQPNTETRMIVERTTEIYGNPRNSLGITTDTKLLDSQGKEISISDFQKGDLVRIQLKDAFTEETPFYYPIVYEIKMTDGHK